MNLNYQLPLVQVNIKNQRIKDRVKMLQIQSPQFSNSSKINLFNVISPTRNKRIVSAEPCCSSLQSNRNNNSYKKLESPSKAQHTQIQQHKRKKSQCIGQGHTKTKSKDLVTEVNTLKQQYTALKIAYKELAAEKLRQSQKETVLEGANYKINIENQKLVRQNENLKGKVGFLEGEIQRIKKESIKLVQAWQFKLSAVEHNLSQKQSQLQQLRSYISAHNLPSPHRSSTKSKKKLQIYPKLDQNSKIFTNSLAIMSDSLTMTYHKIEPLSNTNQYLSISLNDYVDGKQEKDMDETVDKCHERLLQVSADIGRNGLRQCDQNKKVQQNFKKMRKQLSKKIEVNIDQKQKDLMQQIQPKTPMQRKGTNNNNKSTKIGKIKLKKEQDYIQSKSSKKKMSAR